MSSKQYGLSIKLEDLLNLTDKEILLRMDKAIGVYEKPEISYKYKKPEISYKYKKPETYIKIEIKNETPENSIL
jgi:hypothetical protein